MREMPLCLGREKCSSGKPDDWIPCSIFKTLQGDAYQTEREGRDMLKCPRDGTTLIEQDYHGVFRVDRCPSCQSLWLDRGELERIQQLPTSSDSRLPSDIYSVARAYELARQKAQPRIACPRCSTELVPREYAYCSQVLIDNCPKCDGIWLDGGELDVLEQFFAMAKDEQADRRHSFWKSLTGLFPLYRIGKVKARFIRKADRQPLSGVSGRYMVKLFDKDIFKDDKLGEPRLDANGQVQCTFDLYDAAGSDSPLERKPDIYLVVYQENQEIFRTPVFRDLDFQKRDNLGEPVTHDLGTFEV
jgi:Zn-finger nucleic acid-binding protein